MCKNIMKSLRILFLTFLGIGILYLFFSLFNNQAEVQMLDNMKLIQISGTASIDGGPYVEIADSLWHNDIRQTLTVIGTFSRDITDGESLILWPRNLRIKLYVNDLLKISSGQRDRFPDNIEYAGNSYQIFYIGEVTTNDIIRIEIVKAYESCRINVITEFFYHIYAGHDSSVYQAIFSTELLHPLIGFTLITVGSLVLIATLFQKYTRRPDMRLAHYLGWFCIVGGITYIYDSSYYFIDLIFPHPIINTLIDLSCIPVLLFFYLMYINSVLKSKYSKRYMRWVTGIFITVEIIPFILQSMGIQDLHVIQDQYVFWGGGMMLLSLWAILYEINQKNSEAKKVLLTSLPLMIGLFFKFVNILLEHGVERSYLRIGILISSLLLLQSTYRYIQRSMQLAEQEQQMKEDLQKAYVSIMLSQIQPHFLYNALNTLEHICRKDGALAAEAIEHFSRYLRGNMNSLTTENPIPFEQELEHVKHYLYIEKLRFGDRIQIEYDLEYTSFSLPTLTLQPIIENAIRHGITKKAEGGVVKLATRFALDEIKIIVTDNGVGFRISDLKQDDYSHVGIANVKKRLELQCNGTLELNSTIGVGTQVIIRLKGMNLI